jgi:hypothetical protein
MKSEVGMRKSEKWKYRWLNMVSIPDLSIILQILRLQRSDRLNNQRLTDA